MNKHTIFGISIFLLIWEIAFKFRWIDPFFLPSPISTISELFVLLKNGNLLTDLYGTLSRVGMAFAISSVIGISVGLMLGHWEKVYRNLEFVIDFFRSTPSTALFPLFLLIFGITDKSKIAIAVFASTLIIIFNVSYGVIYASKARILAARLMGASQFKIFASVIFWESLPQTFIGLKNAISLSLVIVIVAEMFIGTTAGLGHRIIDSQLTYNIKGMYAVILLTGCIGYVSNLILRSIEEKYLNWNSK